MARCINREVKAGRGSPHGGVFLDIAWIKEKIKDSEGHIKRKLPSMYHQFKELADLDITKEPMEVGPTTHYVMGGIRVDADTQMSTIPGLFAAGECASGINGANRLGGNSLSDLIVFGKRAGEYAATWARENGQARVDEGLVQKAHPGLAGAVRARRLRREPVQGAVGSAGHDAGARRHRPDGERDAGGAAAHPAVQGARGARRRRAAIASITPAGTRRSICATC